MNEVQPREIKILETAEDIQQRREEVLGRYGAFKQAISGIFPIFLELTGVTIKTYFPQ